MEAPPPSGTRDGGRDVCRKHDVATFDGQTPTVFRVSSPPTEDDLRLFGTIISTSASAICDFTKKEKNETTFRDGVSLKTSAHVAEYRAGAGVG